MVLDACGCGALPDAADYGDEGTNTLAHVADAVGGLDVPTLAGLGLGNVTPIAGVAPADRPAVHGKLWPRGPGKDTMTGHWELMGASAPRAPTYPGGFPPEVIESFGTITGRGVLCNEAVEGLRAIEEHGARHLETGDPIVYTSQDSVFQVAAHVDAVPPSELYRWCGAARAVLTGEHAVGRVIARPFEGAAGEFRRTPGRRDYALPPPVPTYLDLLAEADMPVIAVGKVAQVFAGRGIAEERPAHDNRSGIEELDALIDHADEGLVFANLVDTDQVHGHRKDVQGFHAALREIDAAVAGWLRRMGDGDLLVLTADHGCDPAHPGTDHTREHAPLLAVFAGGDGRRVDAPMGAVGASAFRWLTGGDAPLAGESFVGEVGAPA